MIFRNSGKKTIRKQPPAGRHGGTKGVPTKPVKTHRTCEESAKYDAFPYGGAVNIVMTHDPTLVSQSTDQVVFFDGTPEEVLNLVKEKGFSKMLLIGGGHLNTSFIKAGLVDEVILDVHPLAMGKGIKLLEGEIDMQRLTLVSQSLLNEQIVQLKYQLNKSAA